MSSSSMGCGDRRINLISIVRDFGVMHSSFKTKSSATRCLPIYFTFSFTFHKGGNVNLFINRPGECLGCWRVVHLQGREQGLLTYVEHIPGLPGPIWPRVFRGRRYQNNRVCPLQ